MIQSLITIVLFFLSAWVAAIDAQGSVIFLFTGPAILLNHGYFFYRHHSKLALAWLAFFGLNLLALINSATRPFPLKLVSFPAELYQQFTGNSPYEAHHKNRDVVQLLTKILETQPRKLDLAELPISFTWERVCFFSPTASPELVAELFHPNYDIAADPYARRDDQVTFMLFADKRGPVYQAVIEETLLDLRQRRGQCLEKSDAILFL
jgi:hypothetical protein